MEKLETQNLKLHDEILHLKAALELSRRETEEVNTHLSCMMMLMKRYVIRFRN